jgi:hypothetical protein
MVMDRRKRLLSYAEFQAKKILEDALRRHRASVAYKVRLRDALRIERSGLDENSYDYATKAHLDFVIQDHRGYVVFGVEWDGPHHSKPERIAKDNCKNQVCDTLNFPLFRIDSTGLRLPSYQKVLEAIVACWFEPKVIYDAIDPVKEISRLDDEISLCEIERSTGLAAWQALSAYAATLPDSPADLATTMFPPEDVALVTTQDETCAARTALTAILNGSRLTITHGSCKVPPSRAHAALWLSELICTENARSRVFEHM